MEIWKDIKGYEGLYQISNLGRVKSLPRKVWGGRSYYFTKERILKPWSNNGYKSVSLYGDKNTKIQIHRIVAMEFIPNTDNKPCVNHKDCNPSNNNVNNLEWCTHLENSRHAIKNDRFYFVNPPNGENNKWSVLSRKDVIKIKKRHKKGDYYKDISKDYPVCDMAIYNIIKGKTWKSVNV